MSLTACRVSETEGGTTFLGSYEWDSAEPWFGGFSGLELSMDGSEMWILSDRSYLARATLSRQDGLIRNAQILDHWHLKSSKGMPLGKGVYDSEGLAVSSTGDLFVSFEGTHRVVKVLSPNRPTQVLTNSALFEQLGNNKSLEALAVDTQGRLYTLPEAGRDANGAIPVFRLKNGALDKMLSVTASEGFRPVGADFGPDGRFYLLERGFSILGFRTQLRRWDMMDGLVNETTLLRTSFGTHDNLEAVSVWRDASGRLRATMISDDNFRRLQRTEIVEYQLPE